MRALNSASTCRSRASSPSRRRRPCAKSRNAVPLDRLLVETDAPFLAPEPDRGKTNEPAYVAHTAARASRNTRHIAGRDCAGDDAKFFACSARCRANGAHLPEAPHELARHDPRLRLVRRRAARGHDVGRVRSHQSQETAAAAARCWSSGGPVAARRPCSSTRRLICASNCSASAPSRSTACSTRTTMPTTRTASTICAWSPTP